MRHNTFGRLGVGAALIGTALLALAATDASGDTEEPGKPRCNIADMAPPHGVLDLYDVVMFVHDFQVQARPADLDQNGIWDLADVAIFVDAFNAGCPS